MVNKALYFLFLTPLILHVAALAESPPRMIRSTSASRSRCTWITTYPLSGRGVVFFKSFISKPEIGCLFTANLGNEGKLDFPFIRR
jgi:hypothetical protein